MAAAPNNPLPQDTTSSIATKGVQPLWWDNTLGSEPVIIPGYSPVKVNGSRLDLYERVYSWSNGYFPDEIVSRSKQLVSGMRLVAHLDGQLIELKPDETNVVQESDCAASVTATGEPVPGLTVSVSTSVEYDGVAISKISLHASRPIRLDGLDFEVYLPDSPALSVVGFKAKEIRKQKDRQDIVSLPYSGEFYNVIGFADGDRSFWWFADNAKGWIWNGKTVTELDRTAGEIRLKQKLIGSSWDITEPMNFQINFLATPVKNLGGEWRTRRPMSGLPDSQKASQGDVLKLWWTNAFAHDAFPYSYYPEQTGKKVSGADRAVFPGKDRNAQLIQNDKEKYGAVRLPYFSAHTLSSLDPVLQRFRTQWEIKPGKVYKEVVSPYGEIFGKVVLTHNAKSYSNHILWRMNEEIARQGFEGIYLDHGPPYDSNNKENGGWIDSNGELQPSLDILGMREFLKRLRVLFHVHGKAGYVFVHNSNREIIPAYTFVYSTIDGEQYRDGRVRKGDYLSTISLNEFRARFSSPQYGVLCTFLPTAWTEHTPSDTEWNGSEDQRTAYRRLMALTLLHDVADWPKGAHENERSRLLRVLHGFGIERAVFHGYWNSKNLVTVDNHDIKISGYHRRDNSSYLFIATNITSEPQTATMFFDGKKLGFQAMDARLLSEGGGEMELNAQNSSLHLTIPAKDFRWLELKLK